jgi:hypothetical protein
MSEVTITNSMITARGINLGKTFVRVNEITPGEFYDIEIVGFPELSMGGTVNHNGWTTGLTRLHRHFNLVVGDKLEADFQNGKILLSVPEDIRQRGDTASAAAQTSDPDSGVVGGPPTDAADVATATNDQASLTVMSRFKMSHKHLEKLSPRNVNTWKPRYESDLYVVFGMLSALEALDYEFCCGTDIELLRDWKFPVDDHEKPDCIVVDKATGDYLIAEFKIKSSRFTANHDAEAIDLLFCWDHDAPEYGKLPNKVVCLRDVLIAAINEGNIQI